MKFYIFFILLFTFFSKFSFGGLVVHNHSNYDVNYSLFGHTSSQPCGTYQSGNSIIAFGDDIANLHNTFMDSSPFWYYYQNGSTNQTVSPPSATAIWDYIKFWSYNGPCIVAGSVGNGCSGTSNIYSANCLSLIWSSNSNGPRVDIY